MKTASLGEIEYLLHVIKLVVLPPSKVFHFYFKAEAGKQTEIPVNTPSV
ncbi:hypothetical protein QNI16_15355 [Cytophagaceae bacterium YF14B1]|uniref:Uncharacterized protein n=1 Tax=Xanthocytophaga flava TaxID=3048013 RepID=A0AAE3U7Q8_9BACT|nr:hypothetical protein [Xanthocytophaga flavus]MDJ1481877.1 hypothetical protein [Xanthocytophaga flavus]